VGVLEDLLLAHLTQELMVKMVDLEVEQLGLKPYLQTEAELLVRGMLAVAELDWALLDMELVVVVVLEVLEEMEVLLLGVMVGQDYPLQYLT
jgi:hypothetical protein